MSDEEFRSTFKKDDYFENRCARDFWIYKIVVWGSLVVAGTYGIAETFFR